MSLNNSTGKTINVGDQVVFGRDNGTGYHDWGIGKIESNNGIDVSISFGIDSYNSKHIDIIIAYIY
ncbi:hypothetical protein HMPREF2540_08625 [Enterobacter sp. HMSC055A11]|nr:hypothetical protein HMPREF2540_08625 [Enterobacter sp. HMSC055A11]